MAKRELSLECDYVHEARCQERARSLVAAHPDLRDHVSVPAVIPELSSRSILASEYVPGSHIDKVGPAHSDLRFCLALLRVVPCCLIVMEHCNRSLCGLC